MVYRIEVRDGVDAGAVLIRSHDAEITEDAGEVVRKVLADYREVQAFGIKIMRVLEPPTHTYTVKVAGPHADGWRSRILATLTNSERRGGHTFEVSEGVAHDAADGETEVDPLDPLELRAEAERIIGEDRVPADVLRDLIRNHGGD